MNVLGENDEWPQAIMPGTAPADMRRMPTRLSHLVENGIQQFTSRAGRRPTHLLLGPTARRQFKEEFDHVTSRKMEPGERDFGKRLYMGMNYSFMEHEGIKLLWSPVE